MFKSKKTKNKSLSIFTYSSLKNSVKLLLIFSLFIGAVSIKKELQKIHVKGENYYIETHVNNSQKKIKLNHELIYFWYKSRSINSTKGGYSGKLLYGKFERFTNTNKLIEQGYFKNGLKCKYWKKWFENGELKSVSKYKNGLKHGKELIYNTEGILISEEKYSKGKLIF